MGLGGEHHALGPAARRARAAPPAHPRSTTATRARATRRAAPLRHRRTWRPTRSASSTTSASSASTWSARRWAARSRSTWRCRRRPAWRRLVLAQHVGADGCVPRRGPRGAGVSWSSGSRRRSSSPCRRRGPSPIASLQSPPPEVVARRRPSCATRGVRQVGRRLPAAGRRVPRRTTRSASWRSCGRRPSSWSARTTSSRRRATRARSRRRSVAPSVVRPPGDRPRVLPRERRSRSRSGCCASSRGIRSRMSRLAGRVAVVTGAAAGHRPRRRPSGSRRRGRRSCWPTSEEAAGGAAAAAIRARGGRAEFVADRRDAARRTSRRMIARSRRALRRARHPVQQRRGRAASCPSTGSTPADWDRVLAVDLRAVYLGCRARSRISGGAGAASS